MNRIFFIIIALFAISSTLLANDNDPGYLARLQLEPILHSPKDRSDIDAWMKLFKSQCDSARMTPEHCLFLAKSASINTLITEMFLKKLLTNESSGLIVNNTLRPSQESFIINSYDDIQRLVLLKSNPASLGDNELIRELQQSESDGYTFYLGGKVASIGPEQYVFARTSSFGALYGLLQNKQVVMVAPSGAYNTIKNLNDLAIVRKQNSVQATLKWLSKNGAENASIAEVEAASRLILRAESLGFVLVPDRSKSPFYNPENPFLMYNLAYDRIALIRDILTNSNVGIHPSLETELTTSETFVTMNGANVVEFLNSFENSAGSGSGYLNFANAMTNLQASGAVIMVRSDVSGLKGGLKVANATDVYYSLGSGKEAVVLFDDGVLVSTKSRTQIIQWAAKGHDPIETFTSSTKAKDSLILVYSDAPFGVDGIGLGYDASLLEAMAIGSNENSDIVFLRSDLPNKKNLRFEYIEKGKTKIIAELDPKIQMNDPKTLEDFLIDAIRRFPNHKNIRLLIGGHGGAEKGLLPDGESNDAQTHNAMSVDDFSQAIASAMLRLKNEYGLEKRINNIAMMSCLMGNSSFIYSLANSQSVDYLTASPEVMKGNMPKDAFRYSVSAEGATASPREYSLRLNQILFSASSFNEGENVDSFRVSDLEGSYDLSIQLTQSLTTSLSQLTDAMIRNKSLLRKYYAEEMNKVEHYGRNPVVEIVFGDIPERDLNFVVQAFVRMAERAKSEGLSDKEFNLIQNASKEVQAIASSITIFQQGREIPIYTINYTDKVMSIYLPEPGADIDAIKINTAFMIKSGFSEFLKAYHF